MNYNFDADNLQAINDYMFEDELHHFEEVWGKPIDLETFNSIPAMEELVIKIFSAGKYDHIFFRLLQLEIELQKSRL